MLLQRGTYAKRMEYNSIADDAREVPTLVLAPFTAAIKLCFERIPVGQSARHEILIHNPNQRLINVEVVKVPELPEHPVSVNWSKSRIRAHSAALLEIEWCPEIPGVWRDFLRIRSTESYHLQHDIFIVFDSIQSIPQQSHHIQSSNRSQLSPLNLPIVKESPGQKFLPPNDLKLWNDFLSSPRNEVQIWKHTVDKSCAFDMENKENFTPKSRIRKRTSVATNTMDTTFNKSTTGCSMTYHSGKRRSTAGQNNLTSYPREYFFRTFPTPKKMPAASCESLNDSLDEDTDDENANIRTGPKQNVSHLNHTYIGQSPISVSVHLNSESLYLTPNSGATQTNSIMSNDDLSTRMDRSFACQPNFTPKTSTKIDSSSFYVSANDATFNLSRNYEDQVANNSSLIRNGYSIPDAAGILNTPYYVNGNMPYPRSLPTVRYDNSSRRNTNETHDWNDNTFHQITPRTPNKKWIARNGTPKRSDFNETSFLNCHEMSPISKIHHTPVSSNKEFNYSGNEAKNVIQANCWSDSGPEIKSSIKNAFKGKYIHEDKFPMSSEGYVTHNGGLVTKIFSQERNVCDNTNTNRAQNQKLETPSGSTVKVNSPKSAPMKRTRDSNMDYTFFLRNDISTNNTFIKRKDDNTSWSRIDPKKGKYISLQDNHVSSVKNVTMPNPTSRIFKAVVNPDSFSVATTNDPFLCKTAYYDDNWIRKQEKEFKKWMNALLTPPEELDCSNQTKNVDVGKLLKDLKTKDVSKPASKEIISFRYHTNSRLNSLRRSARELYESATIKSVLLSVKKTILQMKITLRSDRQLHLDVGLQAQIVHILLCYNPLWLRIGLEAVYAEVIPLKTNSDVKGLSVFILQRLFRDPKLDERYKIPNVRNSFRASYGPTLSHFTLVKFLSLVFFLDQAKMKKLIAHDPCLFCANASIKSSHEILLAFSKDLLSIGDIQKYIGRAGYKLVHCQGALEEYQYAVNDIRVDLRDGVRLTRVMEVILIENHLSNTMRVPAISRLQKVYNVRVALDALKKAGFDVQGNIDPKDIVDGHREKTMSLLWQIIYIFRAPIFNKSADIIQKWWRFKCKPLIEEGRTKRRINAVVTIQNLVRGRNVRKEFLKKRFAALKIQRWLRSTMLTKQTRYNYLCLKQAVRVVENKFRANTEMKRQREQYLSMIHAAKIIQRLYRNSVQITPERTEFVQIQRAVRVIQTYVRATLAMRKQRLEYLKLQAAVGSIQKHHRANILMRQQKYNYHRTRRAIIHIQTSFRAFKQRSEYIDLRNATVIIQRKLRATLVMREQKKVYNRIYFAVITIQRTFRAYTFMRKERKNYQKIRDAVITIQRQFRATLLGKKIRREFMELKDATITIQRYLRRYNSMHKQRREFQRTREATITIQRYMRATLAMYQQRAEYLKMKTATIKLQRSYRRVLENRRRNAAVIVLQRKLRATLASRKQQEEYTKLKTAVMVLQKYVRASLIMRQSRREFLDVKDASITIQRYFRATLAMRTQLEEYKKIQAAARVLQNWFRSTIISRCDRLQFCQIKNATRTIQKYFRATQAMRKQQDEYKKIQAATKTIQTHFRKTLAMRIYRLQYCQFRNATIILQKYFRATLAMRKQRNVYQKLRSATIVLQNRIRASWALRKFQMERNNAACILQTYFRAYLSMKHHRSNYLRIKAAVVVIQTKLRATFAMYDQRRVFELKKQAILTLQYHIRAFFAMRRDRSKFLAKRAAAITIQSYIRAYFVKRRQREEYERWRKTIVFLQPRYTVRNQIRNAIVLQRWFRGVRDVQRQQGEFLFMEQEAINIQSHIENSKTYLRLWDLAVDLEQCRRSNEKLRQNRIFNAAAVVLQNWFRGIREMRRQRGIFLSKKAAVNTLQSYLQATLFMRHQRQEYIRLRNTVVYLQRCRRSVMQENRRLDAVVVLQRWFTGIFEMRQRREEYLRTKSAARTLQAFIRATLLMRQQRSEFLRLKFTVIKLQRRRRLVLERRKLHAVIVLQRWYRTIREMRQVRGEYLWMVDAAKVFQTRYRALIQMREQRKLYLDWLDKNLGKVRCLRRQAVVKIQAAWRGYKVRRDASLHLIRIKQRLEMVTRNARIENTVGYRCIEAANMFHSATSICQIIRALTILDYFTRICPATCMKICGRIVDDICSLLISSNRSVPFEEASTLAVSVLINLLTYPETKNEMLFCFGGEQIDTLLTTMGRWAEKDSLLFPYLCTFVWILCHDPFEKQIFRSLPSCERRLRNIHAKTKRSGRISVPGRRKTGNGCDKMLPRTTFSWGIVNVEAPRTFRNTISAFKSVLEILEIEL